jgi:deferrochelatase/peroxidase EfeB
MSTAFDPADIQGNILRGYKKSRVRHLILEVTDRSEARRWLAASVSGRTDTVPQITKDTKERRWTTKPDTMFNIGVTFEGLRALGVAQSSLDTFPTEYKKGMTPRATKLGDVGNSAPDKWPKPFNEPGRIHLIATIYADEVAQIDRVKQQALGGTRGLNPLGERDGFCFDGDFVHFGYKDNISQPKFAEIHDADSMSDDPQPFAPLGTVLLGRGYDTNFEGLVWRVPEPEALGRNGTFNAFRILEQDVRAFEAYLDEAATVALAHLNANELLAPGAEVPIAKALSRPDKPPLAPTRHVAMREVIAAHMCGRWRDGTPLALSPDQPDSLVSRTNFDYGDTVRFPQGSRCPYGSHIRRTNPRGALIVQRVANFSRRLIRRGMPYGPAYEPNNAATRDAERGLLGNFIGASLGAQFEAMACDWVNVGLLDPRVTGSNDPLIGANAVETGWFDLLLKSGATIRLRSLPRFVTTRGGAYTFLPSIAAIRHLGALSN